MSIGVIPQPSSHLDTIIVGDQELPLTSSHQESEREGPGRARRPSLGQL